MNNVKPQFFGLLAGLFLAVGLVFSAMLVTRAWLKISESQVINVTGSARKNIQADLIVWHGFFSTEAPLLSDAQKALRTDSALVENFFKSSGVTNYLFKPIVIEELRGTSETTDGNTKNTMISQRIVGFKLTQNVEIRSSEIEKITRLDNDSTTLVDRGVLFTTTPAEYIYTKAAEAKIEMLGEATKDAKARAEQIASQGGRGLARLREARMGIFQITPLYSSQTSGEGMNDITSLEKTITAVVSATFSLK